MASRKEALRLPVVSLGAEHLVIGHLMRRNELATRLRRTTKGMTSSASIRVPYADGVWI